jgi:signal transduction histidine kinase
VNVILGIPTSEQYMIDNGFIGLMQAFLPLSSIVKYISAVSIIFINLLLFSSKISVNYILMGFFLQCYGIMMAYYSDFVVDVFAMKLAENQERAQQEVKNKNMFVASISHDLKNPLSSLLGCLDLLKNSTNLTKKDKNNITIASYSGQIMTYLIGNIIDTSKIEAGRFDIDKLPMGIETEVSKILLIEKELAKKKGINMYEKILTPLPKLVYGDAMRFSQILINLIGNAIKFVSKGYIAIILSWTNSIDEAKTKDEHLIPPEEYFSLENTMKIEKKEDYEERDLQEFPVSVSESIKKYNMMSPSGGSRRFTRPYSPIKLYSAKVSPKMHINLSKINSSSDKLTINFPLTDLDNNPFHIKRKEKFNKIEKVMDDNGILVVDIIDTGIGMSEEEQKKLFKPFNQANNSVKAQYGGTGLGLWITKQLVYLMSGFIELRSKPKKGSRFTITLPFKVVKDEDFITKVSEECKTPQTDKFDPTLWKETFDIVNNLKKNKKLAFTGEDKSLHKMKILLVEDEMNNSLMEQVVTQLQNTDCKLFYATYGTTLEVLRKEQYSFNAIVIISAKQKAQTMKIVVSIIKDIKDAEYKQMPICVISGKS